MVLTDAIRQTPRTSANWPYDATEVARVTGVLTEEAAKETADELDRSELWRDEWYVADARDGSVHKVGEDEFLAASTSSNGPELVRYSSVRTITPLRLGKLEVTSRVREALLADDTIEAVSSILGVAVKPATAGNAARYTHGDFLRAHSDEYDGWVASLILYLSLDSWSEPDGGRLALSSDGKVSYSAPVHNSLVLIPLRAGNHHWVEPVRSDYRRMSLTVHLCRQ